MQQKYSYTGTIEWVQLYFSSRAIYQLTELKYSRNVDWYLAKRKEGRLSEGKNVM